MSRFVETFNKMASICHLRGWQHQYLVFPLSATIKETTNLIFFRLSMFTK